MDTKKEVKLTLYKKTSRPIPRSRSSKSKEVRFWIDEGVFQQLETIIGDKKGSKQNFFENMTLKFVENPIIGEEINSKRA